MNNAARIKLKFTLIELLIVVSIIVILIAILLPSLQKAKQTTKSIVCRNNLKQIHLSSLSYTSDNNEWVLLMKWPVWYTRLYDYGLKYPVSFMCPSETTAFGNYNDGFFKYTHYALNPFLCGATDEPLYKPHKISAVTSPSTAIFTGDSAMIAGTAIRYTSHLSYRHSGGIPVKMTGSSDTVYLVNKDKGTANIVYMDGHVEAKTFNSLGGLVTNAPMKNGFNE